MKPRIVVSGVNLVEGGTLSVFQDALRTLAEKYTDRFDVIALVHRKALFDIEGIDFREFPEIKSSWLRRIYFEFFQCRSISEDLSPILWLAMHDITPNIEASAQAVYCHNPSPFYRMPFREVMLVPVFTLFRFFYGWLYSLNIKQNDFVIVQQDWLRREFERRYHPREIIVAHPSVPPLEQRPIIDKSTNGTSYIFFYPALSRPFKNFELILRSAQHLEQQGIVGFSVKLTLDGSENLYSTRLRKEFAGLKSVHWIGRQSRENVDLLYTQADCLIFPSRLETWGLPISEWKRTSKPMLVADLPYAHETVGDYVGVDFVDPYDAEVLSRKMIDLIAGKLSLGTAHAPEISSPFARNWRELFDILLSAKGSAPTLSERSRIA